MFRNFFLPNCQNLVFHIPLPQFFILTHNQFFHQHPQRPCVYMTIICPGLTILYTALRNRRRPINRDDLTIYSQPRMLNFRSFYHISKLPAGMESKLSLTNFPPIRSVLFEIEQKSLQISIHRHSMYRKVLLAFH